MTTHRIDPGLLDYVSSFEGDTFEREIWRVTWATRDPLAVSAAGGRWSPRQRFETIYTSFERDGTIAEINYHLAKAPVMSSAHMLCSRISVRLDNVLTLSSREVEILETKLTDHDDEDLIITQSVGAAANLVDFDGLVVPSVRWDCNNLVVFADAVDFAAQLDVIETEPVNWPAWREAHPH